MNRIISFGLPCAPSPAERTARVGEKVRARILEKTAMIGMKLLLASIAKRNMAMRYQGPISADREGGKENVSFDIRKTNFGILSMIK